MNNPRSKKIKLINKYICRSLVKMFTPGVSQDFKNLLEDLTDNEESIGRKIDQAYVSLQETSRLVERLEDELKTKIEHVAKLKIEHQRYSELARIEHAKAEALLSQLNMSLRAGQRSERIIGFAISLIAGLIIFVLGVFANPYVSKWLE